MLDSCLAFAACIGCQYKVSFNILQAIARLGGQQIKQECDFLKTRTLDQTNQEIMTDIKHSNDEISKLKESFRSLTRSHSDMFKSHELLQEDHAKVTKEMEIIKTCQKDTVPWNIRGKHRVLWVRVLFDFIRGQITLKSEC